MLANLPQYVGKRREKDKKRLHLATFPLSRVALFKLGVLTDEQLRNIIKAVKKPNNMKKACNMIDEAFERIIINNIPRQDIQDRVALFMVSAN